MSFLLFLLYNVIRVPLLGIIQCAGFFNVKIRKTLSGRKGLFSRLERQLQHVPESSMRMWLHMSSMGEYEQGLPLLNALSQRYEHAWFVVTLFSPSVYEHIKKEHPRTIFSYLPLDSYRNAKRFIELIRPAAHVIIRHDIWPNYQWLLKKKSIPNVLVDASISDQRWTAVRKWPWRFRQLHAAFDAICTVSELNAERFQRVYPHPEHIHVCGDTRYDRVYERAMETSNIEFLQQHWHIPRAQCVVAGSTWPSDEQIIFSSLVETMKQDEHMGLVVAPHETTAEHVEHILAHFRQADLFAVTLSQFEQDPTPEARVLVIDRIGLLANLYALGAIAFVGGGFGAGVHNVLEPAAHGCVVSFGPRHLNSPEAKTMVARNIATPVATQQDVAHFLNTVLSNSESVRQQREQTRAFVLQNVNASQRTVDVIDNILSKKK